MRFSGTPILLLACAVLAYSCAGTPVRETGVPAEGQVRGTAIPVGIAGSLEGATVELGGVKGVVRADNTFSFASAPEGKQSIVLEKRFPEGSVRRVLGVQVVFTGGGPLDVKIKVRDATDVDAFCVDCHPPLKKVTRKDQIYRDIHVSGVKAALANSDPTLLDERGRITCESCHTPHRATGFPRFGVGNIKAGTFCNRCHGSKP